MENKTLLLLVISLFTLGCHANNVATKKTTVIIPTPSGTHVSPANYSRFDSILNASKLQISTPNAKPGSKYELATDSNFSDVVNEHFYVDTGSEALVMSMQGYKLRNELRVLPNFKSDLPSTFYHLSADVIPINPREAMNNSPSKNDAMTLLQVHNKGTFDDGKHGVGYIPHPLLRIVYEKSRQGYEDNYWAIIKNNNVNCSAKSGNRGTSECKNAYLRLRLGQFDPEQPTKFDVIVGNKKLVIKMDGKTMVDHDISYWQAFLCYFKAGVYNQFENGKSEAHFYNLTYKIEQR
ncbi:polysaccharide lyase family 7 protein [Shewanella intestini]|uniref:Polysaccharide lyase family 7 protein n=2 Tax=Shewanellaceae TaxID=267890 RepID=A0ABS5HZN2_9GAMM|nr:polysaccharide lyase family 7 protein [Shewanella intestini]MRG36014.1 polysaccharide lyase family 7 protein [Shewanella sp. XMDDZSB0408]